MTQTKIKSIILLSGGLDSVVSLSKTLLEYNVQLAVFFDYGQKSLENEKNSFLKIAGYYGLNHKIIDLSRFKDFLSSSLTTNDQVPSLKIEELNNKKIAQNAAKAVYIPNRNGLFINIAAAIADLEKYSYIIIGANKEEAQTFKDNSSEFINAINFSLENSTINKVKVIAPLIEMDKNEIIQLGIKNKIPFELIYSCYNNGTKHCGECESCLRLKKALQFNNQDDLIKKLF